MKLSLQTKAILKSWLRSFLAGALTLLLADLVGAVNLDPRTYLVAGLVAVLPVIIRALDTSDAAFGR